jgi:hypothetical protein
VVAALRRERHRAEKERGACDARRAPPSDRTHGHVVAEFEDAPRIDAAEEINKALSGRSGTRFVPAEAMSTHSTPIDRP